MGLSFAQRRSLRGSEPYELVVGDSVKTRCAIVALAAVVLAVAPVTYVSAGKGSPCTLTPPLAPIAGVGYTLTDLGTLTSYCGGPSAINDSGQVAGGLLFPNPNHAFLYSAGTMTDINPIPGGFSTAAGINGLGQVVGMFAASTADTPSPYLYSAGTFTDLTPVLGGGAGFVSGINDAGQITGSNQFARAFRYDSSGLLDLGTLGGSTASGTAINQKGWVVGSSEVAPAGSNVNHAFLFDGTMHDLGTLGGDFSVAQAINGSGLVVGQARTASGADHAFLYDGTMLDLIPAGSPFDAFFSFADGINDAGQVVGNYLNASGQSRPFIWSAATGIMDLNIVVPAASGLTLVGVAGINNHGQIIASGDFGVTEHPFLLTPVLGDTTPPVITYSGNAGTYTVDQQVNITCTVSDPDSAVASTTCHDIVGPAYSFNLGVNSFSATATDPAGNVGSATVTFMVIVTYDSLCNLTRQFIANDGVAGSLCAMLAAARAAASRGNLNAKSGMLGAYSNETSAQSGISLTPAQVAILTRLANAL